MEKARKYQKIATKYCNILKNGSNMSYFKEALKIRGLDVGVMKKPHLDIELDEIEKLKAALQDLDKELSVNS